jgi:hypothetical protein
MRTAIRATVSAFLAVAACTAVGVTLAQGPAPAQPIKDRAGFIPNRKYEPLKGTAVGILLYDGQPVLAAEGRFGPADQLVFSRDGCSYRWVYVPVNGKAQIKDLRVPVGDKENTQFKVFPALDMARPTTVAGGGVTAKYSLVEVEVNDGLGSPRGDSFVATRMKVLDGSRQYPLEVAKVIKQLQSRYATHVQEQSKAIEAALAQAQKKALNDAKPTGPREQSQLMYVTWMPDSNQLRVHFRTKITDGKYTFVEIGPKFPKFPLPPPPLPPKGAEKAPQAQPAPAVPAPIARQRPLGGRFKTGTSFGIEFGVAYDVDREGKVVRTQVLGFEPFEQRLPPPPQIGPRPRPIPLPVPPIRPAPPAQK